MTTVHCLHHQVQYRYCYEVSQSRAQEMIVCANTWFFAGLHYGGLDVNVHIRPTTKITVHIHTGGLTSTGYVRLKKYKDKTQMIKSSESHAELIFRGQIPPLYFRKTSVNVNAN